jgi:hypothetical protein
MHCQQGGEIWAWNGLLDAIRRFSGGFEPFLGSVVHRSDRSECWSRAHVGHKSDRWGLPVWPVWAEDHVWFEDRWMVVSLCDEWLTTLCGLILGLLSQVPVATWLVLVQVKNKRERSSPVRPPGVEKKTRLRLRDPVARGVKCGPHGGMNNKMKSWTVSWLSLKTKVEPGLRGSRVMSGDWRRLHRVRGVSGCSPENH